MIPCSFSRTPNVFAKRYCSCFRSAWSTWGSGNSSSVLEMHFGGLFLCRLQILLHLSDYCIFERRWWPASHRQPRIYCGESLWMFEHYWGNFKLAQTECWVDTKWMAKNVRGCSSEIWNLWHMEDVPDCSIFTFSVSSVRWYCKRQVSPMTLPLSFSKRKIECLRVLSLLANKDLHPLRALSPSSANSN